MNSHFFFPAFCNYKKRDMLLKKKSRRETTMESLTERIIKIKEGGSERKRQKGNHPIRSLSEFPDGILTDILSRLPVRTILHCRCVSKTWLDLLSEPAFAKLHFPRSHQSLVLQSRRTRRIDHKKRLCLVDLDAPDLSHRDAVVKLKPTTQLVNSIDGFVCLWKDKFTICIVNPLTDELLTLPQTTKGLRIDYKFCWFGFTRRTNQYKVVLFLGRKQPIYLPEILWETDIYTLGGSDTAWRNASSNDGGGVVSLGMFPFNPNAYLNESIHWISDDFEWIHSFNFGSEKFQSFPTPPEIGPEQREDNTTPNTLGVLRGCLFLPDVSIWGRVDIWVMKDYGVDESWERMFVIRNPAPLSLAMAMHYYQPLRVLENGEILMYRPKKDLAFYDPDEMSFRSIKIHKWIRSYDAISYVPSFMSLRDRMLAVEEKSEDARPNLNE